MRLYAYVLAVALCAGTAATASAQGSGDTSATMQRAGVSQEGPALGTITVQPANASAAPTGAPIVSTVQSSLTPTVSAQSQLSNSNLQAMVHEHAVITSDDLLAMKFNTAEVFIPTEFTDQPVVDAAFCDSGCEAEARGAAGMNHVQDAAWEAQFQAAKMDLAADRNWGQTYADEMQRLHSYCVFQEQAKKAFPRGDDSASQNQRAQWVRYVGEMSQSLGGGVDTSAARIQQSIQQAQQRDAVRAAIMEVLAERAFSQCSTAR